MAGKTPLSLPLAFTCGLAGLALFGPVRENPRVLLAFLGAAFVLVAWTAALALRVVSRAKAVASAPAPSPG